MPQLKLNFASEKMSMIPTIAHLALILCVLGYVTAYQQNCQPNGGYVSICYKLLSYLFYNYNII